jgi:hypothetical protein
MCQVSNFYGARKKQIQNFYVKLIHKWPLGNLRCICEDNIKMDIGEVGHVGVNWLQIGTSSGCFYQ